jgi:hypothetical protein
MNTKKEDAKNNFVLFMRPLDEAAPLLLPPATYPRYTRRWGMLAIVFLLNVSSGVLWISFSPIAQVTADFYRTSGLWRLWHFIIAYRWHFIIRSMGKCTGGQSKPRDWAIPPKLLLDFMFSPVASAYYLHRDCVL